MKNLEQEAEEYCKSNYPHYLDKKEALLVAEDFIAGAKSRYVQIEKIKAQIEVLQEIRSKMTFFEISNMENTLDNLYFKEQELQQKLKQ